jgi:hypothetical protein
MASYEEWNTALAGYFVAASPAGSTVYLSVDAESIAYIGSTKFGTTDESDWMKDFEVAVRSKCVWGNEITLEGIEGLGPENLPKGVAFLAAMVLAAHLMVEGEDDNEVIAETNYFTRLREVFGFSGKGRPPGLQPAGVEEAIWETWNLWLIQGGWLPSADYGLDSVNRYTNYPLSQALLRDGDKDRLERIFRAEEASHHLNKSWDRDRLGTWLRVRRHLFTSKHLRDLIDAPDPRRYEAFVDAVYEAFAGIDWEGDAAGKISPRTTAITQRRLEAGLYRSEDAIAGVIRFHIYPRRPKRWQRGLDLHLSINNHSYMLTEERQGWFSPLHEPLEDLGGGFSYEVQGDPWISKLTVPERNFWILVSDPESPASGVFANWKRPDVGENFLLLCRQECVDQLQILREEDLLTWDHEIPLGGCYQDWVEYRECMVLNPNWDGVLPLREDLYDELKPVHTASISFQGGLRVADQFGGGWLEGYQPNVTLTAFESRPARVRIANIEYPNAIPTELVVKTNEVIADLPKLPPGIYLLHSIDKQGGRPISPRPLRILDWQLIDCVSARECLKQDYERFSLQGAVLEMKGIR